MLRFKSLGSGSTGNATVVEAAGTRPTRLLTDASQLAVSAILEQPDDAGVYHPVAIESRKLTPPERLYPPHLLELLAVVHALKTLRPYLLDKPFELHTDNASLQWLPEQRHFSAHQARWLHLLAEYKYTVVHIPGRTNPADFLTRKRFPDGAGPASSTGYDDPDSELELYAAAAFTHAGSRAGPDAPRFLHADFAAALRAALPQDPLLGPIAAAAEQHAPAAVNASGSVAAPEGPARGTFVWRDGLLYRRGPRRPLVRARRRRAPAACPAGAPRHAYRRPLRPRQDPRPGAPLGLVARSYGCRGLVRADLPHVPARQGGPLAPRRPALPPTRPDAPRRQHQPGLPRASARPIRPRFPAGAY